MNRRSFVTGSAATFALLPTFQTHALDVEPITSPILQALRLLPLRSQPVPATFGANHTLQREVWPENPDMYWDPLGEDYRNLFGFMPSSLNLSARQDDLSAWMMLNELYAPQITQEKLTANGWELVDDTIPLLHYSGSDDERAALAKSMNLVGDQIHYGIWDWITLGRSTVVLGGDEHLVRGSAAVAEGRNGHIGIDSAFHHLPEILRPDTYIFQLLPPEDLHIETAEMAFISKSWEGDVPIIYSIGMQLQSEDQVEPMIETIQTHLLAELFSNSGITVSDSIDLVETKIHRNSLRIDFVDISED